MTQTAFQIGQRFKFKQGDHVICNSHIGAVARMYTESAVEVRLPGGLVCVSSSYPDCYPAIFTRYCGPRLLADTSIDDIPPAEQYAFWAARGETGDMGEEDMDLLYSSWLSVQRAFKRS